MKGYKVFDPDWTCRGKQYTCPGEFAQGGKLELCKNGIHFCEKLVDCFSYYPFDPRNKVAEVDAVGDVLSSDNRTKHCTNRIQIIRELTWNEVLDMVNTGRGNTGKGNTGKGNTGNWNSGDWNTGKGNSGDENTGDWNTGNRNTGDWNSGNGNSGKGNSGDGNTGSKNAGDWNTGKGNTGKGNSGDGNTGDGNTGDGNTGDRNSGDWNSGDRNSGNWNTGDWNTTDHSSGCFNTEERTIDMFNMDSGMTYSEWFHSNARYIMAYSPAPLEWISQDNMTNEEKEQHPEYKTTNGYLRKREAGEKQEWWDSLSKEKQDTVMALPNFDPDIFKECTEIDVTAAWNRRANHE